jgi:hypothetical protein
MLSRPDLARSGRSLTYGWFRAAGFFGEVARLPPAHRAITRAMSRMSTSAGFALDGSKWDGLYLGRRKGDDLIYAGKSTIVSTPHPLMTPSIPRFSVDGEGRPVDGNRRSSGNVRGTQGTWRRVSAFAS